jgi:hypothetical protein
VAIASRSSTVLSTDDYDKRSLTDDYDKRSLPISHMVALAGNYTDACVNPRHAFNYIGPGNKLLDFS